MTTWFVAEEAGSPKRPIMRPVLITIAALGLAFQVGHFIEHAVQFSVWVSGTYRWISTNFCGRDTPYMSPLLTAAVAFVGRHLFPGSPPARQMMVGMELLHFCGNTIFLMTIAAVSRLVASKWVRYAFWIEAGHLCEHIALTLSAFFLGVPIGLSTMFGQARAMWGVDAAVGWRVTWHLVMNLLPMPFVMVAIMHDRLARTGTAASPKVGRRSDPIRQRCM